MVTLTAGGRMAPPIAAKQPAAILERWEATLSAILEHARRYHDLDALVAKRRAWLTANPFHDLHDERHAAMWLTMQDRNTAGAKMMDAAEHLSRLQQQMPADTVDGLGALLGHPLLPYAGQLWAMAVRRMPRQQPIDMFAVAAFVVMEWRAHSEAQEGIAA
jgi:hypothetical protein